MNLSALIDYFIYPGDAGDPDKYRKAKFFVVSMFIFLLMGLATIPMLFTDALVTPEIFWSNILFIILLIVAFPVYKKFGFRVAVVNVFTAMGFASTWTSYTTTGGIYAPDNIWGIIICCWVFLVANKQSGLFWFFIILCTLIFFYYGDLNHLHNFREMSNKLDLDYYFFNYLMATLFIALIIFFHEKGKETFLQALKISKEETEIKKRELELKNKDITDSINYAKKIQYAVLPHEETIYRSIPLSFIVYKPKDIVSGDFFWFHEIDPDSYIMVCADCTGHGIPGALMTVISSGLLNQTVIDNKIYKPSEILSEVDRLLNMTLKQNSERYHNVQDGMDLSLLKVNKKTKELTISSAKRPVIFIRDKNMRDIKGSKFSLGGMRSGEKGFEEVKINFSEDDMLYFFTDGYHDQFGGEKGKKFSSKRLKELFFKIHQKTIPEQKQILESEIEKWRGDLEQVDDICVIGIRL